MNKTLQNFCTCNTLQMIMTGTVAVSLKYTFTFYWPFYKNLQSDFFPPYPNNIPLSFYKDTYLLPYILVLKVNHFFLSSVINNNQK